MCRVPLLRERIGEARPEFLELIDYLTAPGPVSAQVVADVKDLITDGVGPLYNRRSRDDLRQRARRALDAVAHPRS